MYRQNSSFFIYIDNQLKNLAGRMNKYNVGSLADKQIHCLSGDSEYN